MPETLQEAAVYYSDIDTCIELLREMRWPSGTVTCPYCEGAKVGYVKSRRIFQCKDCRRQFSYKVGTIFEDSPIGLDKWFLAMWMLMNAKNGVSSYEIHRAIGVTQKTAWFMMHRVRLAMNDQSEDQFTGEVEADETYIGGLEKNKHEHKKLKAGRGTVGKDVVLGLLERASEANKHTSQVRAMTVPDTSAKTLGNEIRAFVEPGSQLYTDAAIAYRSLATEYQHEFVDHALEYVRERISTNGLENFFSLLKRCVKGTYVHVSPQHLGRYLDEQCLRFNERKSNDGDRFALAVGMTHGKRLTYKKLTAK